jgi:excisionase family DNA binding protein
LEKAMNEELTGLVAQLPTLGNRTVVLYAEKLLYRAEEAADCLGLSRTKIYELIQSGILPAVKVDGCRRVRRDDLRAFVESLREIA